MSALLHACRPVFTENNKTNGSTVYVIMNVYVSRDI